MPVQSICENCGRVFSHNPRQRGRFCSRSCRLAAPGRPLADRVWEKVEVRGPDECWPWNGATAGNDGRGVINVGGKMAYVTRVVLEMTKGPIPDGLLALHTCDNPPCCNPRHLHVGTYSRNMLDAVERGRATQGGIHGEKNSNAKLTNELVLAIFAAAQTGKHYAEIAEDFDINLNRVSHIATGRQWSSVTGKTWQPTYKTANH